jgi:hypothetical protein
LRRPKKAQILPPKRERIAKGTYPEPGEELPRMNAGDTDRKRDLTADGAEQREIVEEGILICVVEKIDGGSECDPC